MGMFTPDLLDSVLLNVALGISTKSCTKTDALSLRNDT